MGERQCVGRTGALVSSRVRKQEFTPGRAQIAPMSWRSSLVVAAPGACIAALLSSVVLLVDSVHFSTTNGLWKIPNALLSWEQGRELTPANFLYNPVIGAAADIGRSLGLMPHQAATVVNALAIGTFASILCLGFLRWTSSPLLAISQFGQVPC